MRNLLSHESDELSIKLPGWAGHQKSRFYSKGSNMTQTRFSPSIDKDQAEKNIQPNLESTLSN